MCLLALAWNVHPRWRLLLAGTMSPRELPIQLPDLKSRLTLALVFQLHELSDEDKLRALQLRASRRGLQMSDEVHKVSGLPRLDEKDPNAVYKTIMDPDLTLPYVAATLKTSIDAYRNIAGTLKEILRLLIIDKLGGSGIDRLGVVG